VGDVVAVTDVDDGHTYYAQLRGFLVDEYYQKSAVITWLVPRHADSNNLQRGFDPSLFVAGFTFRPFVAVLYSSYSETWFHTG